MVGLAKEWMFGWLDVVEFSDEWIDGYLDELLSWRINGWMVG